MSDSQKKYSKSKKGKASQKAAQEKYDNSARESRGLSLFFIQF